MPKHIEMHGRDHRLNGADPIVDLDAWQWFRNTASPQSVTTATATELDCVYFDGSDLFDLSDPGEPAARATGLYHISVLVNCASGLQSTGTMEWWARLTVYGKSDNSNYSRQELPGRLDYDNPDSDRGPCISLSTLWHMEKDATFQVLMRHAHGSSLNFSLEAYVHKVS